MNSMNRYKDMTPEDDPSTGQVSNMLLGKSRGGNTKEYQIIRLLSEYEFTLLYNLNLQFTLQFEFTIYFKLSVKWAKYMFHINHVCQIT